MNESIPIHHQVNFKCMVERLTEQTAWCEVRDGVKVFVFVSDAGVEHRTIVPADNYINLMQKLYDNPINIDEQGENLTKSVFGWMPDSLP